MRTKRKVKTPATGVVGPTPMGGSARRGADQGGRALAFGSDQAQPEGTKTLKPVGFFGTAMPRTAIMDKVQQEDGQTVAVVEAPADEALAPVTIADIDQGALILGWDVSGCCCWIPPGGSERRTLVG